MSALQMFDMHCPKCKRGICQVANLSRKYESVIKSISTDLLLPPTELGILQTLDTEKRPMFASEIAVELDRSYQLIGKRGKMLAERGLVTRSESDQGRRQFNITPLAETSYFNEKSKDELQIDGE